MLQKTLKPPKISLRNSLKCKAESIHRLKKILSRHIIKRTKHFEKIIRYYMQYGIDYNCIICSQHRKNWREIDLAATLSNISAKAQKQNCSTSWLSQMVIQKYYQTLKWWLIGFDTYTRETVCQICNVKSTNLICLCYARGVAKITFWIARWLTKQEDMHWHLMMPVW